MRRFLLVVLTALVATNAAAQTVEITPVVGYRFGGSLQTEATAGGSAGTVGRYEVADAAAFGLHVGYLVGEGELELVYARQNSRLQSSGLFTGAPVFDLALETWQLGGGYLFREPDARVRPFLGIDLGLTRLLPAPSGLSDETRFSASIAAGAKLWLGRRVGIRLEGRAFATLLGADSRAFCGSGSCAISVANAELLAQFEAQAGLILRLR